jgi:hypothetical protein
MKTKLPNNPFEYRDQLAKLEKMKQKELDLKTRIQNIIEGEKPKDVMSWEYYIWESHRDPLQAMTKRRR